MLQLGAWASAAAILLVESLVMLPRLEATSGLVVSCGAQATHVAEERGRGEERSNPFAADRARARSSHRDSSRARLRLDLNIPAFRLDVEQVGATSHGYAVAVGTPTYPTPRGTFEILHIEWNPWWIPPPTEWAKNEKVTPPGPQNPMGRVKLYFRQYYFIHGSPHEHSLGSAASHGCVRMANADALALARLIHENAGPALDPAVIDSLVSMTTLTRRYTVAEPVKLEIRYDLAEVRRDSLLMYPDVYRLGGPGARAAAMIELLRGGYDTTFVDRSRLAQMVREARDGPAGMALDDSWRRP